MGQPAQYIHINSSAVRKRLRIVDFGENQDAYHKLEVVILLRKILPKQ